MKLTTANAQVLLDGLLLENKVKTSLEKANVPEEPFDDRYDLYNLMKEEKQVEEVKMLSDKIAEPLLDLDKCGLYELISLLQKITNDPSFNFIFKKQTIK